MRATSSVFLSVDFPFMSRGCPSLLHSKHGVSAAECLGAAAATADLHAFLSF